VRRGKNAVYGMKGRALKIKTRSFGKGKGRSQSVLWSEVIYQIIRRKIMRVAGGQRVEGTQVKPKGRK
jgi:hypothetical protein